MKQGITWPLITVSSRLAEVMSREDIKGACRGLGASMQEEAVRLPAEAAALVVLLLPLVDEAAAEAAAVACFDIKLAVALADDAEGFS